MMYKLQDLIDIKQFQSLQDMMNQVYSFTTAILDLDGNVLTASGWQDICTKFHRANSESCKKCTISDSYILSHIHEANPGVQYKCMNGMYDYAFPIIIDGTHYGNFFTGQFFFEKPDINFFKDQAKKYGFNETEYLKALDNVPVITEKRLNDLTSFLKELLEVISNVGLRNLKQAQANTALAESQALYHDLVETAQDLIWQADADGRYTYLNPAWEDVFGYKTEEMIGKKFSDFQTKEWAKRDSIEFERLIKGNVVKGLETVHLAKDGREINLIFNAKFVKDENGKTIGTRGTAFDITDRKQAEEALVQEKIFIEALLESVPGYLYVYDDQGNLIRWNKKHETMTCYSAEELGHMNMSDWFEGDDAIRVAASVEQVMAAGYGEVEANLLVKGGGKLRIHSNGVRLILNGKTYFTGVGIDITERKQAEKALKESEILLKKTQEISKVGGWSYNLATNESKFTDEIYKIYGLPVGAHFEIEEGMNFYHPDDREIISDAFSKIIVEGKAYDLEMRFINAQDENCWVRTIGEPVFEGEKVVKINGILMDITDRKQAEESLKESEEKYLSLFSSMNEGVALHEVVCDQKNIPIDYRILDINLAFEKHTGIQIENARNQLASEIYGINPAPYLELYTNVAYSGESTEFETYFPPLEKYFRISVFSPQKGMFATVFSDITDRKNAENNLRKKNNELAALNYLSETINSSLSLDDVIASAIDGIKNAVNADLSFLFLRENDHLILKGIDSEASAKLLGEIPEHKVGECLCGLAISMRKPLYSENIFKDIRCTYEECKRAGLKSFAALPLYSGEEIIGVIGLASKEVHNFESDAEFLETLSKTASSGISNALLFTKINFAEKEIIKSAERYKMLLANLETGIVVHSSDTSILTTNLRASELLGLTEEQLKGKKAIDPYWKFVDKNRVPIILDDYPVNRVINTQKSFNNLILGAVKSANDEVIWLTISGFPVFEDEELVEIVISFIDITKRINAQLEIKNLNKDLEQKVIERTKELEEANKELEEINDLFVGREMRIIELKEDLENLKSKLK